MARAQSAAVQAAKKQHQKSGFDASKMNILFEAEPILLGRDGVLSVQVYSYDGCDPRVGVYRVGVSTKTGKPWQVRDLRPLTKGFTACLAERLQDAADWMKKSGY